MTTIAPGDRDPAKYNAMLRQLAAGGTHNNGQVTLRANQTTTTVSHESANPNSHITLTPLTAHAKVLVAPQPKLIQFTRNLALAAGNVSYTGVGFTPAVVQFTASIASGPGTGWSSTGGADDGGGTNRVCFEYLGGGNIAYLQASASGIVGDNSGGTNYQAFIIASMDADGFTLTWTKAGAPTSVANIAALCWPATGIYISSRTTGSFTITHPSTPNTDQNFTFTCTGR